MPGPVRPLVCSRDSAPQKLMPPLVLFLPWGSGDDGDEKAGLTVSQKGVWLKGTQYHGLLKSSYKETVGEGKVGTRQSWGRPKPMSIDSVMPSSHLILCCPLLLLPSIFPRDPMDCSLPGSSVHEDFPSKSTGVGCHCLLRGKPLVTLYLSLILGKQRVSESRGRRPPCIFFNFSF